MHRILGLVLLVTAALAARAAEPYATSAPCPGCNVVLVSFDSLQAAHVHALGDPRLTTPTIDRLAEKGALFTQAVSPAPWTLPAHMSWFTGVDPSIHKVVNKYVVYPDRLVVSNLQTLSPGIRTLTDVLHDHGYATGGFTGGAGVSGVFGFKSGFDVYSDDVPPFTGLATTAPKAVTWLQSLKGKRFFLFLHGYDMHGQYLPPGGYDKRFVQPPYEGPYDGTPSQQRVLRELGLRQSIDLDPEDVDFWREVYDEKIVRADAVFAGFLSSLHAMKLDQRTVFVLASDHGTEEYEHKRFDHGYDLYDELERVLFVIAAPGIKGGQEIHVQVGTLDIMPTILALVGVAPDPDLKKQIKGRNLVPLMTGKDSDGEDVYMETDYRLYTHKRGLRTRDGWKLVHTLETGKIELYNLKNDPHELKDLSAAEPAKTADLDARLLAHYKSIGSILDHWQVGCSPVYPDQCH
ncbi:MAG: sulfatase-like hydrolase/transferase [Elusimicrobia bacterium]|nr:sulfatase-like hydrolase/transferase [Elusimicrobiota bacterium]